MLFWLLLTGCLEPFGTDRHDLKGFRVAGVRVSEAQSGLQLEPVVVVDGQLWSDAPVDLRWFSVDDESEVSTLDASAEPLATGSPAVLDAEGLIALVATSPSGTERRAVLALPAAGEPIVAIDSIRIDAVDTTLAQLGETVPTVDERTGWTSSRATSVAPGSIARFTANTNTFSTEPRARWMTVGGAGHYLELDRLRADWFTAELDIDDEDLLGHTPLAEGWVTGLTVLIDGTGNSDWRPFELFVGSELPSDGGWIGQRFQPMTPSPDGPGLYRGTLELSGDSPTGLVLTGTTAVSLADLDDTDPYGTEALPCGGSGPFQPDWLAGARCTRSDVDSATVVVELP